MKFGMRECCDVVFKAKYPMQIGKKIFYKGEPVVIFDTLKTSTLEGAATTVYAQGGRGNARLLAWEGDRTMTFTMEDALISSEGLAILTGAGLIEAGAGEDAIYVHTTASKSVSAPVDGKITVEVDETIANTDGKHHCYVMLFDDNDNLLCEPFSSNSQGKELKITGNSTGGSLIEITTTNAGDLKNVAVAFVDFYTKKESGVTQIDIEPDKFGGNFYIEGSTLYRATSGQDLAAEIIIPDGKVQSNFSFTMAGTGDPSTFTFTVDAFPDYVIGGDKKVLATIQIVDGAVSAGAEYQRDKTNTAATFKGGQLEQAKG